MHDDGFNLIVGNDQKPLPKKAGQLDFATLGVELAAVKRTHPDRTDVQVVSADDIVFDTLVRTMDATMSAGFPDLSLLDAIVRLLIAATKPKTRLGQNTETA